jgi:ABC-type glycerol-3-phosphate transport system permease component
MASQIMQIRAKMRTAPMSRQKVKALKKGVYFLLAAVGSILFLIPFAWMVSTAGKPGDLIWKVPPVWFPPAYDWVNFIDSWRQLPFDRFYLNTLKITGLTVIGVVISSSLAGFAFARLRFPGRNLLFIIVLSTMMLPYHVTIIPQYMLFAKLGWVNTHAPLWVPWWFGDAFSIFLLRQFFMTIPLELDDAARIDGCSRFGVFLRIILPLSVPVLAVVAIFEFTWSWNNFFSPLIYLNSIKLFPVALGLHQFIQKAGTNLQYMMAQTVVFVIPVLVVFFIAQSRFVQGIVVTGVKG